MPVALESIRDICKRSVELQRRLHEQHYAPDAVKVLDKHYSITEAAKMVGRTPQAIRDAEDRGDLPPPAKDPATGRRTGYLLSEINDMRDRFATRPARLRSEDDSCILAIQNFKGGVAKSTTSVHVAQYLAREGMRVLLVDCDSQASATRLFGYVPDIDLDVDDTLYPYFTGDRRNISYAIRDTYWDGLKLIPSNLGLYGAEYFLASRLRDEKQSMRPPFVMLRDALEAVSGDFDVIVIDPPPALGMISLNVLYAASAVVVPMPPRMLDFSSTIQFFAMVEEVLESMSNIAPEAAGLQYDFIKILIAKKQSRVKETDDDKGLTTQDLITNLAYDFYGKYMMNSILYESAEIESAIATGKTVYELDGPIGSHKTYRRAIETLDSVGSEVMELIRSTWSSHRRARNR